MVPDLSGCANDDILNPTGEVHSARFHHQVYFLPNIKALVWQLACYL